MSIYKPNNTERGIVLIICLVLLICVSVLGIYGMRNVMLGERVAGNTLEKQRSTQAAESALRYGEWWLSRNNLGEQNACTDTVTNGNQLGLMRVCTKRLVNPGTIPWTGRTVYTPPNMHIDKSGGLTEKDINYYAAPDLYISYLGEGLRGRGKFYELSASGYGGQKNTATVVQSTFTFSTNSINLGEL